MDAIATPQPPPAPGRGSVVDDLVTFLRSRREFGRRKYGTELQPFNGRDAYLDALQELIDLFAYLHQAQLERTALEQELADARLQVSVARAERDAARANLEQAREDLGAEIAAVHQLKAELRAIRGGG